MKRNSNFSLDRTLRNLVYSMQSGELMAIRFKYKGKVWEADTAEEATKLRDHLEIEDRAEEKYLTPDEIEAKILSETKWSHDRFVQLVQHIGMAQQRLLAALLVSPHAVNVDVVAKRVGLSSSLALAGVQSGLAKQVRELGLEPSDLYKIDISWVEGERNRYLTLDTGFRLMARDSGWPPEHIRKELRNVKK